MTLSLNRRIKITFILVVIACIIHAIILYVNGTMLNAGITQQHTSIVPPKWSELSITATVIIFSMIFVCHEDEEGDDFSSMGYAPLILTIIVTSVSCFIWLPFAFCIAGMLILSAILFETIEAFFLCLCSAVGGFCAYQYIHPDLLYVCYIYIVLMLLIVLFHPNSGFKALKFLTTETEECTAKV